MPPMAPTIADVVTTKDIISISWKYVINENGAIFCHTKIRNACGQGALNTTCGNQ